ncbi:N-formylglutamate deformylase [Oryzibacter oryziterrae]|uniref:N-formylglutamate deformylase n=1 Tax=Oryzibacter oryziterrae TaxID=2766474 RepID=UPI001F00C4F6|nr:N-formylglutamate deformylase [Oryzibacter oryziterrae]
MTGAWLTVRRGNAPLVVSLPHTGTDLRDLEPRLVSPWLARKDADWWIDRLYDFAAELDATIVHTAISRTVIDVNRDPSGVSLYPGQATTELCPTTTFDGEPLYRDGQAPDAEEIEARRLAYHAPYHAALRAEIERLRAIHPTVVLYDCHSIRSEIPRLFEGPLPNFNIGTNSGKAADAALTAAIAALATGPNWTAVTNGRFKGGIITRAFGTPESGVHAVQMELACRTYVNEPVGPVSEANWPLPYDPAYAEPIRATLRQILNTCILFAAARR